VRTIKLAPKGQWYDENDVTLPDLVGKRIESVLVTNVLSSGDESTGRIAITFTDQTVLTITEEGQAGYMSFILEVPDSPPPVPPRTKDAEDLLDAVAKDFATIFKGGTK
jgi:hypothetical protein